MKLVNFKKMNKQRKLIVGSIVGVLLILGSILLYRSYALYEEEKEFNVLRGKVPDFGYDIKMLSVVVDGEKSKTIPTRGLYKTQIDCSNGTRGEWDYNAWNLTLENVSENARCNITFTSNLSKEEYNQYIEAGKALRRNTYRGKDITSYHNDGSLYEMISSGRFDDIYVGDYIVANNVTWLVADIDNYLYSGQTSLTKHHATMIPAKPLQNATMNDTSTSEGGYLGSKMVKSVLPNILSTYIQPVFGSHILTYSNFLTNEMNTNSISALRDASGAASMATWTNRQLDLMSTANVTGEVSMASSPYDIGIDNKQYAIFGLKPEYINSYNGVKMNYWLKDVFTYIGFANISSQGGFTGTWHASSSFGVRPRFLIG